MPWTLHSTHALPFANDPDVVATQPNNPSTFRVKRYGGSVIRMRVVVVDSDGVRQAPAGSVQYTIADSIKYTPGPAGTNVGQITHIEDSGVSGTITVGTPEENTLQSGDYNLRLHTASGLASSTSLRLFLDLDDGLSHD